MEYSERLLELLRKQMNKETDRPWYSCVACRDTIQAQGMCSCALEKGKMTWNQSTPKSLVN